jgi:uncharacterized membrane protein YgdD (TMEM256/DUF423 family)
MRLFSFFYRFVLRDEFSSYLLSLPRQHLSPAYPMERNFILIGAVNGFLSVLLGAFGAHALKGRIAANLLDIYQTGIQYHMVHALALILIGLIAVKEVNKSLLQWSGRALTLGILLFSGSLYALALSGKGFFGAITPLGGVCFLTGWALLAAAVRKKASGIER